MLLNVCSRKIGFFLTASGDCTSFTSVESTAFARQIAAPNAPAANSHGEWPTSGDESISEMFRE